MKKLSDHALALARQLYRRVGPRSIELDLAVLDEIAGCGEPMAIPFIAPALAASSELEAQAGARAIARLVAHANPEDLAALDEHARHWWPFSDGYRGPWLGLRPADLSKWADPGEPGAAVLRLASFHGNGFVREEAVKRLALVKDGNELPYLLLRLNDWVAQVRQAAVDAVSERIEPRYTDHFVQNLALVVRLQRTERGDHGPLLAEIGSLLTSPAARPAMADAMRHGSREVRRGSFRFLASGASGAVAQWLPAALHVSDPVIRLWSLETAPAALNAEHLLAVAERLCADPAPTVRREALSILASRFPDQSDERLTAALLDASQAVQAQARFHLRQKGAFDFASFYRNALAAALSKPLAAAISGLTETGAPADADRFVPHLSHPSTAVRRAAIRGLMKLGGDRHVNLVLQRVLDPARSVSGQAVKVLRGHAAAFDGAALWTTFRAASSSHLRLNLLRLMGALSKWDSIRYFVQAAGDDDEAVAALAREQIRQWNARYNFRKAIPTREQILGLHAALARAESKLEAADLALLQLAVRSFSTR